MTCATAPSIQLPKDEKTDTLAQIAVYYCSMAGDPPKRALPPRDHPEESRYSHLLGEEDDHSRGPYRLPSPMTSSTTLPSIQVLCQGPEGPVYLPSLELAARGNSVASPSSANSYQGYLPPVQARPAPWPSHSPDYYGQKRGRYLPYPHQQCPPCRPPLTVPYGKSGPSVSMQQAAPRQRTPIACIYCRKKKVSATP